MGVCVGRVPGVVALDCTARMREQLVSHVCFSAMCGRRKGRRRQEEKGKVEQSSECVCVCVFLCVRVMKGVLEHWMIAGGTLGPVGALLVCVALGGEVVALLGSAAGAVGPGG
ncbi:hypothetical protein PLESTB_000039500 [Pleodorina starrii]|uniref:Uncharacterized protein n=1 Tax=Pleodorina starrii TaxID=330485 RepID=A0A9W6BA75_9CHLO|nr:hypothetical protein PLESTM_001093500 [Pleodorina starrii]GLC47917.1 hypothetical protein PLESTB_000039500 [Pleodorina starrii]GLC70648.1 hypothetical protein PLESTF_001017900 [Pleodorina starrii]